MPRKHLAKRRGQANGLPRPQDAPERAPSALTRCTRPGPAEDPGMRSNRRSQPRSRAREPSRSSQARPGPRTRRHPQRTRNHEPRARAFPAQRLAVERPGFGRGGCEGWRSGRPDAKRSRSEPASSPSGSFAHSANETNTRSPITGGPPFRCLLEGRARLAGLSVRRLRSHDDIEREQRSKQCPPKYRFSGSRPQADGAPPAQ